MGVWTKTSCPPPCPAMKPKPLSRLNHLTVPDIATAVEGSGPRRGPRGPRRGPDPSTAVAMSGTVKWFNRDKGFGFIAGQGGGQDVFVHTPILRAAGLSDLPEGQPVNMRVVETPKGREAISVDPVH